mmetsp:Transcript_22929/g.35321  ORF Transcript_22929/g.35321 Transcript_22929/m.35321 type:complete len:106 (-) Transcript_22929:2447-2764(-)
MLVFLECFFINNVVCSILLSNFPGLVCIKPRFIRGATSESGRGFTLCDPPVKVGLSRILYISPSWMESTSLESWREPTDERSSFDPPVSCTVRRVIYECSARTYS